MMGDFRVHHIRFFAYTPCAIHCLKYEESTQKLALSRSDGSIELWSIKDKWFQEKVLPPIEGQSVEALIWCGPRLFSAGLHGNIHEHDLLTGGIKSAVPSNSGPIWCLTENEDKTMLAAGTEDGCVVLFDVLETGVRYNRALSKQEGRILSLAWHSGENVIVTGGVDNVRIWSVHSGHAIRRLTMARQDRSKETIVWALAVTPDFTIISGDSTGKTCFWNGKQGTLIKSYQSHKADVLTLCVNKEGTSVFSGGIDTVIVQFEYIPANPDSDWKMWVRSSVRSQHSHDVRAVTLVEDCLVSGGVDCQLIVNHLESNKGVKTWRRLPPIPPRPLVSVAKTKGFVLLRYPTYLELWRLGSTNRTSEKSDEILKLKSNPIKLLQLNSRSGEHIVCCDVSPSGEWLAYSDRHKLRLFQLNVEDLDSPMPKVTLTKVSCASPSSLLPASLMAFTPDGSTLVTATVHGSVQMSRLEGVEFSVVHTFPAAQDNPEGIHILSLSPTGKFFATGDHGCNVHVYSLKKRKRVCSLPHYRYLPTAIGFSHASQELAVSYADQKIFEYSITDKEYTSWCRKHSDSYHSQWLKRYSKVSQLMYSPSNPDQLLVRDEQMFCIIDKTQPFPPRKVPLFGKQMTSRNGSVQHAFHICTKFKYMLHMDLLDSDFLLLVERTPLALTEALPPTLDKKKFGT